MLFTDQTFVILPKRPSRNLWPIVAQGICSLVLIWSKPRWTAAPNTWGNWVAVLKQKALTILATPKMPLSTAEESRALSFQPACLLSLSQLPLSTAYANTYTTSLVSFLAFCVFFPDTSLLQGGCGSVCACLCAQRTMPWTIHWSDKLCSLPCQVPLIDFSFFPIGCVLD